MTQHAEPFHDPDPSAQSGAWKAPPPAPDPRADTDLRSDVDRGRNTDFGSDVDLGRDAEYRSDPDMSRDTDLRPDVEMGADPSRDQEPGRAMPPQPPATQAMAGGDSLWPQGEIAGFEERWRDVQLHFVDDPQRAASEARTLVSEVLDRLTNAVNMRKTQLDAWSNAGDNGNTEQMLTAVRQYRVLLNQVFTLDSSNRAA